MASGLRYQLTVETQKTASAKCFQRVIFIYQKRNLRVGRAPARSRHRASDCVKCDVFAQIHCDKPFYYVSQFADIARPSVIAEHRHRFAFDRMFSLRFDLILSFAHEMMNETWDVGCPM